jgi:hypothetical protein
VLKVVGNWYGMKQAGRIWGLEAAKVKQKLGWTQSQIEGCVFFDKGAQIDQKVKDSKQAIDFERRVLAKGKLASIVCLWVDDGIGGVRQEPHALKVHLKRMKQMDATWGIKLEGSGLHRMQNGEERAHPSNVKDFEGTFAQGQEQTEYSAIHLSIEVRKKGGRISISCEKFLRKVLERVGYGTQLGGKGRPAKTPFPQGGSKFGAEKDEPDCISKERDFYRSTVPALNYAATWARPDLKCPCSILSKYMHSPKKKHIDMLDYALRFVKATVEHHILYEKTKDGKGRLSGAVDASYADDPDNRRSHSGGVWMLNEKAVSWMSHATCKRLLSQ